VIRRWKAWGGSALLLLLVLVVVLAGCSPFGRSSSPRIKAPASTVPTTTLPPTTIPGVQASGARTVLTPIGLNVRAQPATTGKVLGIAAQGVTLTVIGYDPAGGGWYHVRGAAVTGWISANSVLSAPGDFKAYSSTSLKFDALYPATWTVKESSLSTEFVAPAGGGTITVVTGANVAALPRGHTGYVLSRSEQIVVCGVTSYLDVYTTPSAGGAYLAQISLALDRTHALGIEASLPGPLQLPEVRTFAASVSFPYPACQG
jgi:hypothetical protein